MPLPGPRIPKRRGRPKRKGQQIQTDQQQRCTDNNDLNMDYSTGLDMSIKKIQDRHHQSRSSSNLTTSSSVYDKPREERSYKDFYPDLNVTQTLTIIRRTRNPYSDDSAPMMNDTTIMNGISTVPVSTTRAAVSTMNTNDRKRRSLGNLDSGTDLANDNILDDTIVCSTSLSLLEQMQAISPKNNKYISSLSTTPAPAEIVSPQLSSSPIIIHGPRKKAETHQALTSRSPIHHITNSGAVDLSALPKPRFHKVTDDTDEPRRTIKVKTTTSTSASTKLRRNSHKRERRTSGQLSSDTTLGSDVEYGIGGKDNDDNSDDGGNESSGKNMDYRRPDNHYIRYIEPTEQSLFEMMEYDMDEQDEAWLQMLNMERKINRLGHVSCSFFENVIDKLEKEWFDLVKNLPKQDDTEPLLSEDSACSICDDGECENSNAIVFCDGCNLAVHQDCYGVPYIPEGQWLCRKCMVSPDKPVSCLFCPNEGGAFKQTNTNKWGHLLCALWIPEVGVSNSVYMEPIDNIEGIPKSRWKLTCYICKKRNGACIQCDNKHCFTAFHVTCARWARLCMRMKSHGTHYDSVLLKAYCDRHTPRDYRDEVDVEKCVLAAQKFLDPKAPKNQGRPSSSCTPRRRYVDELDEDGNNNMEHDDDGDGGEDDDDDDDDDDDVDVDDKCTSGKRQDLNRLTTKKRKRDNKKNTHGSKRRQKIPSTSQQLTPSIKAARAHQHHYSAGAPIAPDYILTRLENLKCVRQTAHLRRRCQLIASICRYWSLKRESRRGAPLLKRLHLEPWTASSSQSKQNELQKTQRAKALFELRADLEIVRMLSEQVQKREKQKLEKLRRQKEYLEMILFPVEYIIRPILNQLMEMDKKEYFLYPVTPDVAPDYLQYIDYPMSFHDIIERFHAHEYTTLNAIEADLSLIWTNSKTYNKSDTSYYKLAQRMEEQATESITKAQQVYRLMEISQHTGTLATVIDPDIFSYSLAQTVPLLTEEKIETNAQCGHCRSEDMKEHGGKDQEMVPTNDQMKLTRPTKLSSTSKQQGIQSMETKKRLNSSPKRITRSSSTEKIHTDLNDRPRKRRKHASRLSPSTPTSTPLLTASLPSSVPLHNTGMPASTLAQESQSTKSYTQTPITSSGNDQTETTTLPFYSSPLVPEQTLSSLSLSPEQQSLSSEQQSPPSLSSEQKSFPSLSSEQQQQPLIETLSTESLAPLIEAPSTESTAFLSSVSPASPILSHSSHKSPSHIKRVNKLKKDNMLSRRRTRSTGSDGLTIPTKSGMKNRKMNKETRKLLMPDTADKPIAYEEGSYKESTTRRAPCGYVYISSSDEDDGDNDDGDSTGIMIEDQRNRDGLYSSTTSSTGNTGDMASRTENSHPSTIELDMEQNDDTGNKGNIENKEHRQSNTSSAKKTKSKKPSMLSKELHTTTPGEIVWARVPSFPFHPAKIIDVEQESMSQKLLANRTKEKTVLVKFYQVPESHKWGWIRPADIYKFGDEENDRIMLEQAKMMKKNKKSRFNEVFEGYEYVRLKLGLQALQI